MARHSLAHGHGPTATATATATGAGADTGTGTGTETDAAAEAAAEAAVDVVGGGSWAWGLVRFSDTARPPPPVILPGAAVAALRLAGALRRASPCGLALPPALVKGGACGAHRRSRILASERVRDLRSNTWLNIYVRRGAGERDAGVRRRVSDNPQDSSHPGLARAPRGGLRGLRPQALPATLASRPVR